MRIQTLLPYYWFSAEYRLQTLLISRFILNLRRSREPLIIASHPSRVTIPGFHFPTLSDVVGDMGQPLDCNQDVSEDHEAEVTDLEVYQPDPIAASWSP